MALPGAGSLRLRQEGAFNGDAEAEADVSGGQGRRGAARPGADVGGECGGIWGWPVMRSSSGVGEVELGVGEVCGDGVAEGGAVGAREGVEDGIAAERAGGAEVAGAEEVPVADHVGEGGELEEVHGAVGEFFSGDGEDAHGGIIVRAARREKG